MIEIKWAKVEDVYFESVAASTYHPIVPTYLNKDDQWVLVENVSRHLSGYLVNFTQPNRSNLHWGHTYMSPNETLIRGIEALIGREGYMLNDYCQSRLEAMLRKSQTKIIMPVITLALAEHFLDTGQTVYQDSEIRTLYKNAVRKMYEENSVN